MIPKLLICLWWMCCLTLESFHANSQNTQRFNTFGYNVNEGLLQSTIGDAVIDDNNYLWISFPNGIQKFDGNNFHNIEIQPGLPEDKHIQFYRTEKNLYLTHRLGISRYNIQSDKFQLIYSFSENNKALHIIGEYNNKLFIYLDDGSVIELHLSNFKIENQVPQQLPPFKVRPALENPIVSKANKNHKTAIALHGVVYLYDLKNHSVKKFEKLAEESISSLLLDDNDNIIIVNYYNKFDFIEVNSSTGISKHISLPKDNTYQGYRLYFYNYFNKWFLANVENLYQFTEKLDSLEFRLVNSQSNPIGEGETIRLIVPDKFKNLYCITVREGIRKVMYKNYPLKYFGLPHRETKHILNIHVNKNLNHIYMGTSGNGLIVFDTMQKVVQHITQLPGTKEKFSVSSILPGINDDILLVLNGVPYMYVIDKNLNFKTRVEITNPNLHKPVAPKYFGNVVYRDNHGAITHGDGCLYKVNFHPYQVEEYSFSEHYIITASYINNHVIYHVEDDLVYLDPKTFKEIKRVHLPNTGMVRTFLPTSDNHLLIGTNKGIIKTKADGTMLWHIRKEDGLPDECIYAIAIDQVNNIWCSTNKGILCLDPNGNILQLKKEDGLQENEFNTNVVFQSPDGEIYFGGVNGATSFYPDEVIKVVDSVKILITGIRVNHQQKFTDTAIWNLKQIELQHDENAISFDLVAMGSLNPDQYVYQYRLVGMDNEWIQKSDMQSIRYLLPPGKYTLQLYASRLFNKNAKPLKELRIIIHPPFYKTWWFATIIGLILLGSLIFGINRYNRSKYIGRLRELENEHRIQMERERISRDLHDNIGAFANAVLYKAQTIGENPQVDLEVIEDLKFASKDIILSLRETIWAFKKESYSSQECMLRIRNFIQTLHRYYENINIHINENHESEKTLSYSRALDLVRLVQEAVTNSLKHAKPKNIMVTSTIDKDKWIVEVKDDGMGFDVVRVNLGNGLDNMKKRAVKSGFEFSLFSKVGEGTRVTLVIS